jgi:hypothetical protein
MKTKDEDKVFSTYYNGSLDYIKEGLSKREYFAIHVLQGLVTNDGLGSMEMFIRNAIMYADNLIDELNRK